MCDYYTEVGFKNCVYSGTDTPMLKPQPPEFKMYTAGSTHYNPGAQMKAAQSAMTPPCWRRERITNLFKPVNKQPCLDKTSRRSWLNLRDV